MKLPPSTYECELSSSSSSLVVDERKTTTNSDSQPDERPSSRTELDPHSPPRARIATTTDEEDWNFFQSLQVNYHLSVLDYELPAAGSVSSPSSIVGSSSSKRKVTFDETVRVHRTNLVLGVHPVCRDGWALACGWERCGTELVPLSYDDVACGHPPPLLDATQRRERLEQATGMNRWQLLRLRWGS